MNRLDLMYPIVRCHWKECKKPHPGGYRGNTKSKKEGYPYIIAYCQDHWPKRDEKDYLDLDGLNRDEYGWLVALSMFSFNYGDGPFG